MHRVISRIRQIAAADLPSTDEQTLLNMGIIPMGGDYYSCREQEQRDASGQWVPVAEIKGTVITEGPAEQRHEKLPQSVKADLWRARVRRGKGKAAKEIEVGMDEVLQTDDVISAGVKKHRWSGERER